MQHYGTWKRPLGKTILQISPKCFTLLPSAGRLGALSNGLDLLRSDWHSLDLMNAHYELRSKLTSALTEHIREPMLTSGRSSLWLDAASVWRASAR